MFLPSCNKEQIDLDNLEHFTSEANSLPQQLISNDEIGEFADPPCNCKYRVRNAIPNNQTSGVGWAMTVHSETGQFCSYLGVNISDGNHGWKPFTVCQDGNIQFRFDVIPAPNNPSSLFFTVDVSCDGWPKAQKWKTFNYSANAGEDIKGELWYLHILDNCIMGNLIKPF